MARIADATVVINFAFMPITSLTRRIAATTPSSAVIPGVAARELAIRTEAISTAPMTTMVASPLTPVSARPFFSSWIIARPIAVPQIVPEPPKMLVPPSTTAAMTSSS